jgi:hypothetical protein
VPSPKLPKDKLDAVPLTASAITGTWQMIEGRQRGERREGREEGGMMGEKEPKNKKSKL